MSDPLSIAASIVSLSAFALHGTHILLDDLNSIADAPREIRRLKKNVEVVEAILLAIKNITDDEWRLINRGKDDQPALKAAITSCEKACSDFQKSLKNWTRHSPEGGKLSLFDRLNVGVFKESKIGAMSDQLETCKTALTTAVGVSNLLSTAYNSQLAIDASQQLSGNAGRVSPHGTTPLSRSTTSLAEPEATSPHLLSEGTYVAPRDHSMQTRTGGNLSEDDPVIPCPPQISHDDSLFRTPASDSRSGSMQVTFGDNHGGLQTYAINAPIHNLTFGGR